MARTLSLNHVIEPFHPTRSAKTVAGIVGVSAKRLRTFGAKSVNDVDVGFRSYFGG